MLAVLRAVQVVDIGKEARRVSFRNIDVEQIGYMYEGALGYTSEKVEEPIVGLLGMAGVEPEVPLAVLEKLQQEVGSLAEALAAWIKKIKKIRRRDKPRRRTGSYLRLPAVLLNRIGWLQ